MSYPIKRAPTPVKKEEKRDGRPPFLKKRRYKAEPVLSGEEIIRIRRTKRKDAKMFKHCIVLSYDDSKLSPAMARGYIDNARGRDYRRIKRKLEKENNEDIDDIHDNRQRLRNLFPKQGPGDEDIVGNIHPLVAMVRMQGQHVYQSTTRILKDYGPTIKIYRGGTKRYHLCLVAIGLSWDIYIGLVEIDLSVYKTLDFFKGLKKRARPKTTRLRRYDDGRRR